MDEKGYDSVKDFLGIATDASLAYSEMPHEKAQVNAEFCTNCGRCLKACFYQAMQPGDAATWVEPGNCIGCGGCYSVCPAEGAIEIEVVS
jgi:heterodisulfide reductase subunit A-like polyferredoxin